MSGPVFGLSKNPLEGVGTVYYFKILFLTEISYSSGRFNSGGGGGSNGDSGGGGFSGPAGGTGYNDYGRGSHERPQSSRGGHSNPNSYRVS